MQSLRYLEIGSPLNRETTCARLARVGGSMVRPAAAYLYRSDYPIIRSEVPVPWTDERARGLASV
ncbi:MAG: hypothetical protein ABH861_03135 [Patescibacteria group bacterium]